MGTKSQHSSQPGAIYSQIIKPHDFQIQVQFFQILQIAYPRIDKRFVPTAPGAAPWVRGVDQFVGTQIEGFVDL